MTKTILPNKKKTQTDMPDSRPVRGKQSNHDEFSVPPVLAHMTGLPLYFLVAQWGFTQGIALTRTNISEAFRISPRRASDVMNYLHNARQCIIASTKSVVQVGRGCRESRLTITAITGTPSPLPTVQPERPPERRRRQPSIASQQRRKAVQQMRNWFLHRPNPLTE